jgi:hypothetical protein
MTKAKVKVRPEITRKHWGNTWIGLRQVTQTVLEELERFGAKQVNLRLNESGQRDKRPVFIDWVAVRGVTDRLAKKSGISDYGEYRFGDSVPSKVYSQALDEAGRKVIERDWDWQRLCKEKRVESRLLVQKAGLMHQKFIGIIAEQAGKRRCVGTLTVSFAKRPRQEHDVKPKMKQWAAWPKNLKSKECIKSRLVKYIENHIALGGPVI